MKVIAYLTEPASYTVDLIKSVHIPNKYSYRFLINNSYTNNKAYKDLESAIFLNKLHLFQRYVIIKEDYRNNDVIIFNGYDSISFLILWWVHIFSVNKKYIAIESDTPLKIPKNFLKRLVKKVYLNYLFKNKYLHALAGGNDVQMKLFSYYGMSKQRIHFLPMVIDVKKFDFKPKRKRNDIFTFLFVGRFIPLKQIHYIIEEFVDQFKNNSNVQLVLVGDGDCYSELNKKYSRNMNIIFKGALFHEDLTNVYKCSHSLILASNNENWGLVINEAMSASLVVLSNIGIGANYDMIIGKETGILFDAKIKGDLGLKMIELFNDHKKFEKFSENAHRWMHNYWNFELYDKQLKLALTFMQND